MVHQQKRGSHHQKIGCKSLNFVEIFSSRVPVSSHKGEDRPSLHILEVKAIKVAPLPSSQASTRRFHARLFVRAVADKKDPWLPKAWTAVCNAIQRHIGFLCDGIRNTLTEMSFDAVCSHQNNVEGLPSLGQRILLYVEEKSLASGHILLSGRSCCECNLAKKVDSFRTIGEGLASIFVGLFFQTHAKEVSHLAQRLVNSEREQRSVHHHMGFARLQGEPALMFLRSSQPEIELDERQEGKEPMPCFFAASQNLIWKLFGQRMLGSDCHRHHHQQQQENWPNKEMLNSVEDFFNYTELEGKKVFKELDRDADGKLTLDDLKVAMRKMKLPLGYAKDFMQCRHGLWPVKDYGWQEFSSLLLEKEPVMVQLFNSLGVSKSGTVKIAHVRDSLLKVGLLASEDTVTAMMRFLSEDASDGLKYGQFRRFMLLLPTEQLAQDPWSVWLKAATAHRMEHLREDLRLPLLDNILLAYRNMQNKDMVEEWMHQSS